MAPSLPTHHRRSRKRPNATHKQPAKQHSASPPADAARAVRASAEKCARDGLGVGCIVPLGCGEGRGDGVGRGVVGSGDGRGEGTSVGAGDGLRVATTTVRDAASTLARAAARPSDT
jgi:hypothetical protein